MKLKEVGSIERYKFHSGLQGIGFKDKAYYIEKTGLLCCMRTALVLIMCMANS